MHGGLETELDAIEEAPQAGRAPDGLEFVITGEGRPTPMSATKRNNLQQALGRQVVPQKLWIVEVVHA